MHAGSGLQRGSVGSGGESSFSAREKHVDQEKGMHEGAAGPGRHAIPFVCSSPISRAFMGLFFTPAAGEDPTSFTSSEELIAHGQLLDSVSEKVVRKIPELTWIYWIVKILATTLGETFADMISQTMSVGYAVSSLILIGIFIVTLIAQIAAKKYYPLLYWSVIMSSSLGGTTISDFIDRTLNMGYPAGMGMLLGILIGIFIIWRLSGFPFSVQGSMSRGTECFYWTAIIVSNTLGTALGDFTADSLDLGFAGGAGLYGGAMAATALLAYFTPVSRTLLFWVWFVLTRPFGATFGDYLNKPTEHGGLGLGTEMSSLAIAIPLIVMFIYLLAEHRWRQSRESAAEIQAAPLEGGGGAVHHRVGRAGPGEVLVSV